MTALSVLLAVLSAIVGGVLSWLWRDQQARKQLVRANAHLEAQERALSEQAARQETERGVKVENEKRAPLSDDQLERQRAATEARRRAGWLPGLVLGFGFTVGHAGPASAACEAERAWAVEWRALALDNGAQADKCRDRAHILKTLLDTCRTGSTAKAQAELQTKPPSLVSGWTLDVLSLGIGAGGVLAIIASVAAIAAVAH